MRAPGVIVALGLAAALAACSLERVSFQRGAEDCASAGDEDGNGLADCQDPACSADPACQPVCGNGKPEAGEACDDGNAASGDACEPDCTLPACGNHIVDAGEQCDDGNAADGDACEPDCTLPACGNHIIDAGEQCDDGPANGALSSGCSTACHLVSCGNGVQDQGEACDDGNAVNGDTCDVNCTRPGCGNAALDPGEQCDDGNAINGDTCDTNCTAPRCGNAALDPGEECDDGNAANGDACDTNCTTPRCGNAALDPGEQCDDGNLASDDGCDRSCRIERCGDGIIQLGLGESCDDGNAVGGDGCDAACHVEPFTTIAPVKISGGLACTTAVANAARKIAVDGNGTIYAVMTCGATAQVVISVDRGRTFTAPFDLSTGISASGSPVAQVAVATGPTGVAYVAIMLASGEVFLRTTQTRGLVWGPPVGFGVASNVSAGLSLQSFNADVYLGVARNGGVDVASNHARGTGGFAITQVAMSVVFFDLLYDVTLGTLAVCADSPTFHVRASSDAGVSFGAEINPPGAEHFSDWAIGNGRIFVSGTNFDVTSNSTRLFVIPTSNLATSSSVAGLPLVSTAQSRSVAADAGGNAFVASQLDSGGVQLDRLAAGASAFDPPRLLDPRASSPIAAPLPGNTGAAVVFTIGSEVWATIQAY